MKIFKPLPMTAALVVASMLAAGCALPPEEEHVLLKLDELDRRVGSIERVVRNESLLQIASELEMMREEVRELRGHTEALQYDAEGASTRQRDQYLDLDQRLQSLERRTRGGEPLTGLPTEGGRQAPVSTVLPVPTGDDRGNYQAALELLRQGRYPQAEAAFSQFLAEFPQSDLADNARYWLGETHYVNRDFEPALAEFKQVIEQHPNSRKVPDALLKAGFCEYELQRFPEARKSLETVVEQFPDSTAARLATQRLEKMRAERR
jgi:tol-pal system protein YbgF